MVSVKVLNIYLTVSCFVGLALSIYAYVIEQTAERDENYKAICDVNEYMSCSKVFKTKYAKGFGIFGSLFGEDSALNKPNSLAGMIFYSLLIVFAQQNAKPFVLLTLLGSAASVLLSVYLAYLLAFVIHSLCLVCVGTYVVNLINLVCSVRKYKSISAPPVKSKKKKA